MITRVVLTMETVDGRPPSMYWSYNLYAQLLRGVDEQYAAALHDTGLKPISQYLQTQKNTPRARWVVNLLTEQAREAFLPVLMSTTDWPVEKQGAVLRVIDIDASTVIEEADLVERNFREGPPPTRVKLELLTPCAFKTEGEYAVFPSPRLIVQSAVAKWNALARDTEIADEQGVEDLIAGVRINGYALRSCRYAVKGVWIPSFAGTLNLSVRGPAPMCRLFGMLTDTLPYTGLGIKCALGMGAVNISDQTISEGKK